MKIGKYRSKFEKYLYDNFLKGTRARYESIVIPFLKTHTYRPDWVLPNGIIIEAKGRFTSYDRAKHLLIKKQQPHLDIRFVFSSDNKISKRSETRYSEWCEQHHFLWAINEVPQAWLNEPKKKVVVKQTDELLKNGS